MKCTQAFVKTVMATAVLGISLGAPQISSAKILPPNDLYLQDNLDGFTNVTREQFNEIIDEIMAIYIPIALARGVNLTVDKNWSSSVVNAYASQPGPTDWEIAMFGGLARRPEVTPDGFALVVCHELGHHFGGFAFYRGGDWAASEGQSDYYATQACAQRIWGDQRSKNAESRASVDPVAKSQCDTAWTMQEKRDLCYRSSMAGHSLANLLAALGSASTPKFDTPDTNTVSSTYERHPAAQCRLDTYFQGALCTVEANLDVIPGRNHPNGQESAEAEKEAADYSCTSYGGQSMGHRPACWFKAGI